MKQNRLNERVRPYRGRARPGRIKGGIAVALALAVALLCIPESSANKPDKKGKIKTKTAVSSLKRANPAIEVESVKPKETPALSASGAKENSKELIWQIVASGTIQGGTSVTFELSRTPGYVLDETIGQLAVGWGSSDSYEMNSGYWQNFEEPDRGDANGDGIIDIGDVIYLINYLFTGTSAPDPLWAGDCNCDGIVDIGDVIYLINYLFTGTSPPGC